MCKNIYTTPLTNKSGKLKLVSRSFFKTKYHPLLVQWDREAEFRLMLNPCFFAKCNTCHSSDVFFFFFFNLVPQGVVRDTAGYAVMLKWTMSNIYGLSPGDVRQ